MIVLNFHVGELALLERPVWCEPTIHRPQYCNHASREQDVDSQGLSKICKSKVTDHLFLDGNYFLISPDLKGNFGKINLRLCS